MLHPKTAYAPSAIYNFAVLCIPVGRPGMGFMGSIWSLCFTRTGCVLPRQAELTRSTHCRLAYRQATSRSNQWTMDEVSRFGRFFVALITADCSQQRLRSAVPYCPLLVEDRL